MLKFSTFKPEMFGKRTQHFPGLTGMGVVAETDAHRTGIQGPGAFMS